MKLQKNKREKEREVQSTRNVETKPRKENERKEGTDHQNMKFKHKALMKSIEREVWTTRIMSLEFLRLENVF